MRMPLHFAYVFQHIAGLFALHGVLNYDVSDTSKLAYAVYIQLVFGNGHEVLRMACMDRRAVNADF
jgi:hypothetical protein